MLKIMLPAKIRSPYSLIVSTIFVAIIVIIVSTVYSHKKQSALSAAKYSLVLEEHQFNNMLKHLEKEANYKTAEVSSIASNISEGAGDVHRSAKNLSEMSKKLSTMLDRFKTPMN